MQPTCHALVHLKKKRVNAYVSGLGNPECLGVGGVLVLAESFGTLSLFFGLGPPATAACVPYGRMTHAHNLRPTAFIFVHSLCLHV